MTGRERGVPWAVILIVLLLSGCSGDTNSPQPIPEPVSLEAPEACDVCGMVIAQHHGPSGQIFYRNNRPRDHGNPARFDSLRQGLFPYYFEHKQLGWTVQVIYVTDYSRVDYRVETIEGEPYIDRTVKPETFSRANDVVFVVGSNVRGAMGKDFIPFSDRADARRFAREYGGELLTMDQITVKHLRR